MCFSYCFPEVLSFSRASCVWSKASSARMFIIQHLAWIPKIFEAELEELMGAAKEIAKVVANDL